MAESSVYLAVDLGASSGRVVAGSFDGTQVTLEEAYRFENGGVLAGGHLYWDLLNQWGNVVKGLRAAAAKHGNRIRSVGVDTWGVDFGLLGRNDELLGNPYHYRDTRTVGLMEQAFKTVPRAEIFAQTGLQFMEFNTLYQLIAMQQSNSPLLEMAERLLMIPDLFHWLLTGEKANEYTDVSTSQFYNPQTGDFARPLLEKFNLPTQMLGPLVKPGDKLGPIKRAVAEETGLNEVQVVLPGTHDTASAVMAVPAASVPGAKPDWCYISSGTWSLMGVETPQPIINDRMYQLNFTNEGGVGGTTRVLKNIAGLWLVQQCRQLWKQQGHEFGWEELTRRAGETQPLLSLVDPDAPAFVAPRDMPAAIREYCQQTGQPVPQSEGAVIRCALESLALRYRMVLGLLEELVGGELKTIHIVGGGSLNRLLCQMTADCCNRRVVAGPVEATAIGNVMLQAVTDGTVGSIAQAREVIRHSFSVQQYLPQNTWPWNGAYERFMQLVQRAK
ncbi:Rhamnulokinase [Anatilimnocola aggregata]|uniref:Rhamnulokinase n=1 Tax=Anatilimnocola aggregata TaxID=2528021 RepID=A0A517YE02_9BACT|nr:rhamnulokinase family protein [Anatilimnocola aggregata]QDU28437.1 Rhamnulokinase [Anatilimnocola aggregata]